MENFSHTWPEVLFSSSDPKVSQALHRGVKAGQLIKLATRVYTSNLKDTPENIVKRNLYHILGNLFPGAVLSHRTALEGGPSAEGLIVLSYKYSKPYLLPGFRVHLMKGHGPLEGDTPFMGPLFLASRERALLENLQPSRHTKNGYSTTVPRTFIEQLLDKACRVYGTAELNVIRDRARVIASTLDMNREFEQLDALIGTLLGTQSVGLHTEAGVARAAGPPIDTQRLELFASLLAQLKATVLAKRSSTIHSEKTLQNFAFFEAYFSNYIEGIQFEVEEARAIVFGGKQMPTRPQDAHDVLGTFKLASSRHEMNRTPTSVENLFQLLQERHLVLLGARPEKNPGFFKEERNRVGSMVFVDPTLVKGTLAKAFDLYQTLEPGIARAIFIMFVIAEVHPFLDGNGKIARIMMNAELEKANECRIIIPTVFREDYILTLRRLSNGRDPLPYIKMLCKTQAFTQTIDFSDYQDGLKQLEACNAFMDSLEGKLRF